MVVKKGAAVAAKRGDWLIPSTMLLLDDMASEGVSSGRVRAPRE
jgi:hypothetical protein